MALVLQEPGLLTSLVDVLAFYAQFDVYAEPQTRPNLNHPVRFAWREF